MAGHFPCLIFTEINVNALSIPVPPYPLQSTVSVVVRILQLSGIWDDNIAHTRLLPSNHQILIHTFLWYEKQ